MTYTARAIALLSCLAAAPVAAQIKINMTDQMDAIRLAGSEEMLVHLLSYKGLPKEARVAREKLLHNMGLRGPAGTVGNSALRFSPILTHDSNINGGFGSDGFTFSGIPFQINEKYKAVDGIIVGVSATALARISLEKNTSLELRAGGSIGYSPEHDMFKNTVNGSACVKHMFSYSTHGHACLDASYRTYDLGEETRVGAKAGVTHITSTKVGVHALKADLQYNKHFSHVEYDQMIGSASVTTAISGPYAITVGFQVGENVPGQMVMQERVFAGLGFKAFDRPSSVMIGLQRNSGGMFLGNKVENWVSMASVRHQITDKFTVSGTVAVTDSSDSFFNDTQYGVNVAWRW